MPKLYHFAVLNTYIELLKAGRSLTSTQVSELVPVLLDSALPDEPKADLLIALAQKGETTEELAAFATNFRERSLLPTLSQKLRESEILDVCGTGGDRLNTFNISTTVALIVAAAEIPVAKHGNRAITSSTGSADVLEALGIPTNLSPDEAAEWLERFHFAFFFAQLYHPAFKHLASTRKLCAARGHRSIFNLLGPLLNPARPSAQLIGVPASIWCEKIARAAQSLGVRRAMVVSGKIDEKPDAHLDEISIFGDTTVAEFFQDRGFSLSSLSVQEMNLPTHRLEEIRGGDAIANARIIEGVLTGTERGARRLAVVINAGAALFVANRCKSITQGIDTAIELIDSGATKGKLDQLRQAGKDRGNRN